MGGVCNFLAGYIQHTAVAPGIVLIFYHNFSGVVKQRNNICLQIFSIIVCIIIFFLGVLLAVSISGTTTEASVMEEYSQEIEEAS